MNIALLATRANISDLASFVNAAAKLQEEVANGAIMVVFTDNIAREEAEALAEPLRKSFKAVACLPVPVNRTRTSDMQVASLFARFLVSGYSKFPGAWLIVDGFAVPTKKNFMTILDKQHGVHVMSGKFLADGGKSVPLGPVTLSENGMKLKFLRFVTNQTWRQRGCYHFARCAKYEVPADEYCFALTATGEAKDTNIEKLPEPASDTSVQQEVEVEMEAETEAIFQAAALDVAELVEVEVVEKPSVVPTATVVPSQYVAQLNSKIQQGTTGEEITAAARKEFLQQGLEDIRPIAVVNTKPVKKVAKKFAKKRPRNLNS